MPGLDSLLCPVPTSSSWPDLITVAFCRPESLGHSSRELLLAVQSSHRLVLTLLCACPPLHAPGVPLQPPSVFQARERGLKGLGGSFADKLSRGRSPPVLSQPCPGLVQLLTALALLPRVRPPLHTHTHALAASHPCALPHPGPFSLQTQFDPTPRRKCLIRDCLAGDLPRGCRARSFSGPGFAPSVRRPRALCGFARELLVLCPLLSIPVAFLQVLAWWARRGDHSTHVCFVRCSSAGRDLLRPPCPRYSPSWPGGSGGFLNAPRKAPAPPRRSVYIVFLCIWVKDVQYKSSVCSRYDFIFITCIPCSSHPLHASEGCLGTASLGFGPLPW